MGEFDLKYLIGIGGYGKVYKVKFLVIIMVVKKFNEIIDEEILKVRNEFFNEIRVFMEICYRNVVKLFGFCLNWCNIFLVYEYMERGSLRKVLGNDEEVK